jgi:hypothetical protein
MKYIIIDIDGTVSNPELRLNFIQEEPKDWDNFYKYCEEDYPHEDIIELLKKLYYSDTIYRFLFCTGRRESCREDTRKWIHKHINFLSGESTLLMRENGDKRHDTKVKPELLLSKNILPIDVWFILEDRNSMVKKWRELGYRCLQVQEGDF